jgi:hypothetical protein
MEVVGVTVKILPQLPMTVIIDPKLDSAQQAPMLMTLGKTPTTMLIGIIREITTMILTSITGIAFSSFTVTVQVIKVTYKTPLLLTQLMFTSEAITIPLHILILCSHFSLLS